MKAQLTMPLGNKQLTIEGEGDSKVIIKHFAFWTSLPQECGLCHKTDIALNHRNHDGNDFYEMRCNACNATLSFGQHKTGGTLFVKHNDGWSIYEGKKATGNGMQSKPSSQQHEEIPF